MQKLVDQFKQLLTYLNGHILGQEKLTQRLVIALLTGGHLLVEGAPGLAKTTAIKVLASCIEGDYHRIQFTPDLLPADLTGTDIYRPQDGSFYFQKGPIFHNIILADEVNRSPAKVQSALLEAMAENQVTIGRQTYALPELFMVMATQNPIEQEGTYHLPEAQLDRFLMYVTIDYPAADAEQKILRLNRDNQRGSDDKKTMASCQVSQADIFSARQQILNLHMSAEVEEYIVQLIMATRDSEQHNSPFSQYIRFGASPRGTIALDLCARAHAWLSGQDFVSPSDVHAIIPDVLRHRILLNFEAEAENVSTDEIINQLLNYVAIP
ncbi:MAG: MoxR family ATPase [Coxiellaceae bacterium]|nr:MoxR family ATPase [Coxiellaceae bacterium]